MGFILSNPFKTMNPSFLIKYASRGRPDWFRKAIQNIVATIDTYNYLILVTADLDDTEMNNEWIRRFCANYPNIKIIYGYSKTKVQAINAGFEHAGEWDILINMSDDMHFVAKGWDNVIVNLTRQQWPNGDFFAHFNDGYAGAALSTMSIMDRKYYERDGYIYHPSYRSFSCDAEAYYVAILRERHHYFSVPILFKHQHPTNTPTPNDATYTANSRHTPHDTKNYFERLNNNFFTGFTGQTIFDRYKTNK